MFKKYKKKICVFVVCLALCVATFCCSLPVGAYVQSDVKEIPFTKYSIDNYTSETWENIYTVNVDSSSRFDDGGLTYDFDFISSGLVGPDKAQNSVTLSASMYMGDSMPVTYLNFNNFVFAPNPITALCFEMVDCYSVISYRLSDGENIEQFTYKVSQMEAISSLSNPPSWFVTSEPLLGQPTLPPWKAYGFMFDPLHGNIRVSWNRPVFVEMITTYCVFNFYPGYVLPADNFSDSEKELPALQFLFSGKGISVVPSSAQAVYNAGLTPVSVDIGEYLKNYETDMDDVAGSLYKGDVGAVAQLVADLTGGSGLLGTLFLISLAAAVVSAIIGVAVYYGRRKK